MDELKKKLDTLLAEMRAIHDGAVGRDLTEDEQKAWDAASAKVDTAKAEIKRAEALASVESESRALPQAGQNRQAAGAEQAMETKAEPTIKKYASLRNFSKDVEAYRFGQWCMAAMGHKRAGEYCQNNGLELRTHTEGVNTAGGFLVPEEFDNSLVDLRETYGVFRRNARVVPMGSDTITRPVRTSGLTAYFAGEGDSLTSSDMAFNQIRLVANKLTALSYYTSELNEDAVVNIGDDLAGEIAWAFAQKEDDCGFNGNGHRATYGGILGVINKLTTQGAGVNVISGTGGSNDDWSVITVGDLAKLPAAVPGFVNMGRAKWFCSKTFFGEVMVRLAYAAGGNTVDTIGGGMRMSYMGYPVEIVNVMPKADTTAEIVCLFGDLALAADFGDRRQTTIAFDSSIGFTTDTIAVKGTERFDINVHSLGSTTVGGPIAALLSAA